MKMRSVAAVAQLLVAALSTGGCARDADVRGEGPQVAAQARSPQQQGAEERNGEPVEAASVVEDRRTLANDLGAPKVYLGEPVKPGAYLSVVAVAPAARDRFCTGSLIGPEVVLTAGHCHCDGFREWVYVGDNAGADRRPEAWYKVRSSLAALDGCTQSLKTGLDLALLRLDRPVAGVRPLSFAPAALIDRATSWRAVGFGAIDANARDYRNDKREGRISATSNGCSGKRNGVEDSRVYGCQWGEEIVAGRSGGVDTCNGDSGGPLLVSSAGRGEGAAHDAYLLAGVTSRPTRSASKPCGDGGIYERLGPAALRWLTQAQTRLR